ncbi:kinase-like domain-containing protein [Gigaspora margarita]|uniref:Kinase-like domain-containing protein n=1 Tax=Gigaspora margarita TaxID=4874 RepID=A0A8H4APQ7_GIGMA|nr:kinase-like domain-containing protein [Gigaspora margarita]
MPSLAKASSNAPKSLFLERVERNLHSKCIKRYTTFTNTQFTCFEPFKKVFHVIAKCSSLNVPLKSYENNIVTITKEIINELNSQQNSIIRFYNVAEKENNYGPQYIPILNYSDHGILKSYLQNNFDKLNWSRKLDLAQQLADAIKFMHENEIIHGNFHSNNILIYENNIKFIDFWPNMAHFQNEETYKITKKSDIYMLGVLMWEISKSRPPFEPPKEICQLSELTIDMLNDAKVEFIEKSQMTYIDLYTGMYNTISYDMNTVKGNETSGFQFIIYDYSTFYMII